MKLREPIHYINIWQPYNKYDNLPSNLKLVKRTAYNYSDCGWYVIEPYNFGVGVFDHKADVDDLDGFDIDDWNRQAEKTLDQLKKLKAFT